MRNYIILIVVILISSCTYSESNSPNWKKTVGGNLEGYNLGFDKILILNEQEALLFGSEDTPENFQEMSQKQNLFHTDFAVIYKTNDGGQSWKKQILGKGGAWTVCRTETTIFAAKAKNNGRFALMTSVLFKSEDNGETWQEINEYLGNVIVMALDSSASGLIAGIKVDSSEIAGGIFNIKNGKISSKLEKVKQLYNASQFGEEVLYFEQSEKVDSYSHDIFSIYNLKSSELISESLPKGFDGYFAYKDKDVYWIIGRRNEQVCIYKMSKSLKYELIHCIESDERIFPEGIVANSNKILAIVGTRKDLWTESRVFYSNNGVEWQEEVLPKPEYLKPVGFYISNNKILGMGYSGTGTLQIRQ